MAYTMEDLLSVLHPHCPVKVDALCKNRRRVEHGLTTVGLKIHCLGDKQKLLNLIEALGGQLEVIANRFYAHARASVTVILPPVGSACSAIMLLECIEKYFGHLLRSDHTPFWEAGIPAVMWTDTSEFRNPHYHRATDTPDTLDYQFLAQVTRLALARAMTRDGK